MAVSDDFLAMFLVWANLQLGFIFAILNLNTTEGRKQEFKMAGLDPDAVGSSKLHPKLLPIFIGIVSLTMTFLSISIQFEKRKVAAQNNQNKPGELKRRNNIERNKEVVGGAILIILSIFGATVGLLSQLGHHVSGTESERQLIVYLLADLSHGIAALLVFPALIFAGNPDLRIFLLKLMNAAVKLN